MKSINCIVETPKGSGGKFDFEPESGRYKLQKMLPAGLVFPFDFGFIPGTIGEHGKPLEVIIISETVTFTGCAIDCRIIGGIKARQTGPQEKNGMRNNRYIAIPEVSTLYRKIDRLRLFPQQIMQELEQFFLNYSDQAGTFFQPLERMNAAEALKQIQKAQEDAPPTALIQLLLPLYDGQQKAFPQSYFTAVQKKLTAKFGGVTIYTQSPAAGLWKNDADQVVSDKLLVFEVMVSHTDSAFWKQYKKQLQQKFSQEELVIRRTEIGLF